MYWLYVKDRKTSVRTRISQGANEYDDYLQGQMARQLRLKRDEFDSLIECPLSEEDYVRLLTEGGDVSP